MKSSVITRYRRILFRLFGQVLEVNVRPEDKRLECLAIQEELIKRISYAERRIKELKDETKRIKVSLKKRLPKFKATEVKQRKAECQERVKGYQELISLLRQIGDGLAFTYLDKLDIKPLAFKPPPGAMTGKRGSRLERKIFRKAFLQGHVALLNDLTHCLRYGDVTIVKDGRFILVEAKSGENANKRTRRQEAGIKMISDYILNDKIYGLYGHEHSTHRIELGSPEINYQSQATEILRKTAKGSSAYAEVEDGLFYAIISDGEWEATFVEIGEKCSSPLLIFLNNFKHDNTGNYPFTLSIRDPQTLLQFFLGEFLVMVTLDLEVLRLKFKKYGIRMQFMQDNTDWPLEIVDARKDISNGGRCRVSKHFFGRIFVEFLSIEWFVEETTYQAQRIWKTLYESSEPNIEEICIIPPFLGIGAIGIPIPPERFSQK